MRYPVHHHQRRSCLAPLAFAVLTLSVAGCHRAPAAAIEGGKKELESAGHKLEGFAPVDATRLAAYRCEGGRIDGVDALLCEYGDPAAARTARPRAEAWIGTAVTGITLERGKLVLALSDRSRSDPNGRAIGRIAKSFNEKGK